MARRLLADKKPTNPNSPLGLLVLARSLEAREPVTKGHAQRVAAYAQRLAIWMGFEPQLASQLELAGLVHDIGKLVVPVSILTKNGPLTDEEWAIIQRHPSLGEELCRPIAALAPVLPAIRSHHERWDGRGYPDGLSGLAIPEWARLLAVADSFDALTSDRSYRRGLSFDQALTVLQKGAGKQWDPDIVKAFVSMFRAQTTPISPSAWTAPLVAAELGKAMPIPTGELAAMARLKAAAENADQSAMAAAPDELDTTDPYQGAPDIVPSLPSSVKETLVEAHPVGTGLPSGASASRAADPGPGKPL